MKVGIRQIDLGALCLPQLAIVLAEIDDRYRLVPRSSRRRSAGPRCEWRPSFSARTTTVALPGSAAWLAGRWLCRHGWRRRVGGAPEVGRGSSLLDLDLAGAARSTAARSPDRTQPPLVRPAGPPPAASPSTAATPLHRFPTWSREVGSRTGHLQFQAGLIGLKQPWPTSPGLPDAFFALLRKNTKARHLVPGSHPEPGRRGGGGVARRRRDRAAGAGPGPAGGAHGGALPGRARVGLRLRRPGQPLRARGRRGHRPGRGRRPSAGGGGGAAAGGRAPGAGWSTASPAPRRGCGCERFIAAGDGAGDSRWPARCRRCCRSRRWPARCSPSSTT